MHFYGQQCITPCIFILGQCLCLCLCIKNWHGSSWKSVDYWTEV